MSKETPDTGLPALLAGLSSPFSSEKTPVAIILAAGQGKRIKSRRSKMLHFIWGVPTVVRVARAAAEGLQSPDQIIVVGIKAREVAETAGILPGRKYVLQLEQKGTGHAVKIALESIKKENLERDFYIIPGDMGLLDTATVRGFAEAFRESKAQMMVMVGIFQGDPGDNYYGRILQVPEHDASGKSSGVDRGKIIQILEHRDILALDPGKPFKTEFRGRTYSFSQHELLEIRFYNSGFYAFSGKHLAAHIEKLGFNNVQAEMYFTDLIYLFNQSGLAVQGVPARREETLLGFNDKAVLAEMQAFARVRVWEKLNKTIYLADKDDFFIDDDVVEHILQMDREEASLDIVVGEGAYLGHGVRLSEGVSIEKNARLSGNIILGKGVHIGESAQLSAFPGQTMRIGDNTRILAGNIIKGDVIIGKDCLVETPVRITGSTQHPGRIGNGVCIKGSSYLFGCIVEDECQIINCILKTTCVHCRRDKSGNVIPVCYISPAPEGRESLESLI